MSNADSLQSICSYGCDVTDANPDKRSIYGYSTHDSDNIVQFTYVASHSVYTQILEWLAP